MWKQRSVYRQCHSSLKLLIHESNLFTRVFVELVGYFILILFVILHDFYGVIQLPRIRSIIPKYIKCVICIFKQFASCRIRSIITNDEYKLCVLCNELLEDVELRPTMSDSLGHFTHFKKNV